MVRSLFLLAAFVGLSLVSPGFGQIPSPPASGQNLINRALALADLYNWADAAPLFQQARSAFEQAGDSRNALYARLGFIRANIERQQDTLPAVSHELGIELDENPLLRTDTRLRLFAFVVKGDIDAETDTAAMRNDWEQVQALARELGDSKWTYRSLAMLGVAAFYDGNIETARKSAGAALAAAAAAGDIGAQIRILTILGRGLVETKAYDQALPYLEKALQLATSMPESGYPFPTQEVRIGALSGLKQFESAKRHLDEVLRASQRGARPAHEATALGIAAEIDLAMGENSKALATLQLAISKAEEIGLVRLLAKCHAMAAEINRQFGNLAAAEQHLASAARATRLSGDTWAVPQRLQMLAELHRSRGQYEEASDVYDQAEAFVDAMIGKASTVLEKTALIRSASDIYTKHFSLVADHFKDPAKAYGIVEQVRGRIAVDQLLSGARLAADARTTERTIARLRLNLMKATSTAEVKRLRDEIFLAEQARWVSPGVSILKRHSSSPTELGDVQRDLPPGTVVLEYVISEPSSYCLVITSSSARIVSIAARQRLEKLSASFLTKVKAKQAPGTDASDLYNTLVRPTRIRTGSRIVVIRDGPLHLLPFEAFVEPRGRYLAQAAVVSYAPSTTSFHLLNRETVNEPSRTMLGVGGVGYAKSGMNSAGIARGNDRFRFAELPSSGEEIRAAANALKTDKTTVLSGNGATETAFKRANLSSFQFIHLAVHAFADRTNPDRAALVMLSDARNGEDGFLYAPEIVQLGLSADLVVLSACETAVGPLQGQEGIANLSRAFLFAGGKSVLSTLWQADDAFSALLMKRFYTHVANKRRPDEALTAAKRDVLGKYGARALPYHWAGFIIEGGGPKPQIQSRKIDTHVAQSRDPQ